MSVVEVVPEDTYEEDIDEKYTQDIGYPLTTIELNNTPEQLTNDNFNQ